MGRPIDDKTGRRFGRLIVLRLFDAIRNPGHTTTRWLCRCDCGKELPIRVSNLVHQGSCGCLALEQKTKHGHARKCGESPEYVSWQGLKERCNSPRNHGYPDYGARGITVCERWRDSFENFLSDMGLKPTPKHSIDRIDNDGNYEPGNCRWATTSQQQQNQRRSKLTAEQVVEIRRLRSDGMELKPLAQRFGVSSAMIGHISRGTAWR